MCSHLLLNINLFILVHMYQYVYFACNDNGKVVNLFISHNIFLVPTIQKLGMYLEKVTDWEAFGYQLLPEEKGYLMEVATCIHYYVTSLAILYCVV